MLIARWSAEGDRELIIKRILDINYISIKSRKRAFSTENYDSFIFNPDKRYLFELKEDSIELHERAKLKNKTDRSIKGENK
jgi:hypothetical protein